MTRPKPIPARPDLSWLKKTAKDRLTERRAHNPAARLNEAQREIAHEYGFASWRAMKAHVDRLTARHIFAPDGTPMHLPTAELIARWPEFTPEQPLKILMSGCLAGQNVLGGRQIVRRESPHAAAAWLPNVAVVRSAPRISRSAHRARRRTFTAATGTTWLDGRGSAG